VGAEDPSQIQTPDDVDLTNSPDIVLCSHPHDSERRVLFELSSNRLLFSTVSEVRVTTDQFYIARLPGVGWPFGFGISALTITPTKECT
jgi:hypothetical protein